MNKAKRQYALSWWGWRPFTIFSIQRGSFSGYVQVGPYALVWFG